MEQLFVYITDFSSGLAYLIVFAILVACGLGLPLPEDIPLIASGYLCWQGTMNWPMAMVVTMAGVIVGDTMLYLIGRKLGPAILEGKAVNNIIKPKRIKRGRAYFRKYGEKIVFFARFVAGFRAAVFFIAGVTRMPYLKFIALDTLAALLSVPIWIGLGHWLGHKFGDTIEPILEKVHQFKTAFTILIAVAVVAVIIRMIINYRKSKLA